MNDKIFFDHVRKHLFGGSLTAEQVEGLTTLLGQWRGHFLRDTSVPQFAYCLATAFHETGGKMVPVSENLNYRSAEQIRKTWPSRFPTVASAQPFVKNPRGLANKVYNGRMGNVIDFDDGWNFRGRGLPQLTGRANYERATKELRKLELLGPTESLVATPDLALRKDIAVFLLIVGMEKGWFTGVTLDKTIDDKVDGDERRDFESGRRIINGIDKAGKIAGDGMGFLNGLVAAGALKSALSDSASPAAIVAATRLETPLVANVAKPAPIPVLDAYPAPPPPPGFWQRVHSALSRKA